LFQHHGFSDFKWIDPREIIVSQWVRLKCQFGCKEYGRNASCPPATLSAQECREFFNEYGTAILFHFHKKVGKPEDRKPWSRKINRKLLRLERGVFLSGYHKAFLLCMDSCELCAHCAGSKDRCRNPELARPTPEGMAVDVFSTVRHFDYPIEVLCDYSQAMNRYAFLLIE
jgi:predicted metal-binding protein